MSKRSAASSTSCNGDVNSLTHEIVQRQIVEIPCFTGLPRDSTDLIPIEFRIDQTDQIIDLSSVFLYLRLRVKNVDGTNLKENDFATTANNFAYSMWSKVELYINDTQITHDQSFYPWMVYVRMLTCVPDSYRQTMLASCLWQPDQAGLMGENNFTRVDVPVNSGAKDRAAKIQTSDELELYSRIVLDFHPLPPLLPSDTDVVIRFTPAPSSLSLIHDNALDLKLTISTAILYVAKCKLTAVGLSKMCRLLSSKGGFTYLTTRYTTFTRLVVASEQNVDWLLPACPTPSRIFVWQIAQSAFNGSKSQNIFDLKHFNLKDVQVFVNDLSLPINTNLPVGLEDIARLFATTSGAINNPDAWQQTPTTYLAGYFVIAVNCTDANIIVGKSGSNSASIRLKLNYKTSSKTPLVIFCMIETDNKLRLRKNSPPEWNYPQ